MRKVSLKRKRSGNSGDNGDDSTSKADENINQNGGGDEDVDPLDGTEKVTSTTTKKKGGKSVKKGAKKAKTAAKSSNDADEKSAQSENDDDEDEDAAEEEKEEEYEVEDIIDHKTVRGKIQYLIRWKGYDADNDTWEPESTVNCPDIIERYNEKNVKPAKKGKSKKDAKEEENQSGNDEAAATDEEGNDDAESEKSLTSTKKTPGRGRPKPQKKVAGRGRPKKTENNSDEGEDDDEVEYEVEKIIDVHFKRNGEREFLIRWKGFKSNADTWEPEDNVNCADLIDKFMKKVNDAKGKQNKELRVDRNHTKRFTLEMNNSGRRLSKRYNNKQRVSYFENE